MTVRFLVKSDDRDKKESAMLGLLTAFAVADRNKLKSIAIVVPVMGGFESTLNKVVGRLKIKGISVSGLINQDNVDFNGTKVTATQPSKISSLGHVDVLVVYASTLDDLEAIDSLEQIGNIVYVPWLASEQIWWADKWNPVLV
ncbi:hypothetical protein EC844_105150 [Acinetobacter calcoaceticus]|uniref:Uncharacterized protein n=1 Tax=Acinetobacter calcoaceticus TaxID=471 RepID=A0A4R1XWM5_ACICA|nr:hypothetical protein EC844_105150 [Acinetobacter calcoaceticus]